MSTELYQSIIDYDYGDQESSDLQKQVWEGTPWVVDVFTGGGHPDDRDREIRQWCHDEMGEESYPIHGKEGVWHMGGATVYGWTWMGFSTRELMDKFCAKWVEGEENKPYD